VSTTFTPRASRDRIVGAGGSGRIHVKPHRILEIVNAPLWKKADRVTGNPETEFTRRVGRV
jgi:hypothetical protein